MNVTAVIPARMGSSRFPGKPLVRILDLPMVEHVRRRALLCEAVQDVIVATCDQGIVDTVAGFGGKTVMTSDKHERCTDRVEEAMRRSTTDIVVILQGDEPLIVPEVISRLIEPFKADSTILCTNLLSIIHQETDLEDCDIVKAVLNQNNEACIFQIAVRTGGLKVRARFIARQACPLFINPFTSVSKLVSTPLNCESVDF